MAEEEDLALLPLDQRWRHSKWQARVSAYKDALTSLERQEGLPDGCGGISGIAAAASDTNVVALDAGIRLLTAYILASSSQPEADIIRQAALRAMAEKGLVAVKPSAKQAALDACLAFVEVATPEDVIRDLLDIAASTKNAKLTSAVLNVLVQIFTVFGGPVADLGPVISTLPRYFALSDRNTRVSASQLSTALYRFSGRAVMDAALRNIKPVQLKELQTQWEASSPIEPTRSTRSQQSAATSGSAAGNSGDHDVSMSGSCIATETLVQAEIDPWDTATPKNVIDAIPSEFEAMVSSVKWKERKEALEAVVQKLDSAMPRLEPGSGYNSLTDTFCRILAKDSNIICAQLALTGVEHLASGLRNDFGPLAPRCLPVVMERYREKKQSFIDGVSACLDALFPIVTWQSFIEISLGESGLSHRVPGVRLHMTKYLAHILQTASSRPDAADAKLLASAAAKMAEDTLAPHREAGTQLLAVLIKLFGQALLGPILSTLSDIRRTKVSEAAESVVVKASAPSAANPPSAPLAAAPRPLAKDTLPPPKSSSTAIHSIRGQSRTQTSMSHLPSSQQTGNDKRHVLPPSTSRLQMTPSRTRTISPALSAAPLSSSTPKVPKRGTNALTPAHDHPAMRRRLQSPGRPEAPTTPAAAITGPRSSSNTATVLQLHEQLVAAQRRARDAEHLLAGERSDRAKIEARLTARERELSELRVSMDLRNRELEELKRQLAAQSRRLKTADAGELGSRMSTLSIDKPRPVSSRPRSQGFVTPAPIRASRGDEKPEGSSAQFRQTRTPSEGPSEWERAVKITADLRRRISQMREEREKV